MSFATDWKLGSVAEVNAAVGTKNVLDPERVLSDAITYYEDLSDYYFNTYSQLDMFVANSEVGRIHDARLIVDGAVQSTNASPDNSTVQFPYGRGTKIVGSSSNLWGVTGITPKMIKRPDFGVALSFCNHDAGSGVFGAQSYYLVVKGFNHQIPHDATIIGIETEVSANIDYAGPGISYYRINYVKTRVHYDYSPVLKGQSKSFGYIDVDEVEEKDPNMSKAYQYMASEGVEFMGQWRDVITEPSLTTKMNELPGELQVTLARNLDSKESEVFDIALSGFPGEVLITTQNDEVILGNDNISYGIGEGTDLEVDHDVTVREFYGGYEFLLDHDGEPILTHDAENIMLPVGFPRGRNYYRGYVSDYGFNYEQGKVNTAVNLLHLSDELNNEIYKTVDTLKTDNFNNNDNALGFGSWPKSTTENNAISFSFTPATAYKLSRFELDMSGWRDNLITAVLRTGSTPGTGTILGTAYGSLGNGYRKAVSFAFASPVSVTSTPYNITITSGYDKQTQSQNYPAFIYAGSAITGAMYYRRNTTWTNSGYDAAIKLWQEGGNVRVSELSKSPSQIQRNILDYNLLYGGIITYDRASIKETGTIVSAPFNTNTLKEGGDYVLKLAPSNWYYRVDPGDLLYYLLPRPDEPNHIFTLGKDVIKFTPHKNIENIINDIYFTGGGDPALFIREVSATSRSRWRKGLRKMSDIRVTDETTARILMQSELGQASEPQWIGQLEISRVIYPRIVHEGDLIGLMGFGNILDTLEVQASQVQITPDKFVMQLGTIPPKTTKRIEDIKRNLTRIEIENNPNNPL